MSFMRVLKNLKNLDSSSPQSSPLRGEEEKPLLPSGEKVGMRGWDKRFLSIFKGLVPYETPVAI